MATTTNNRRSRTSRRSQAARLAAIAVAATSTWACGGDDAAADGPVNVTPAPAGEPHQRLSEWHLFSNVGKQAPAQRVEPYEVSSPLWSDATHKRRFLFLPDGAVIGYRDSDLWQFPVGAILVKSFGYLHDARDPSAGEQLLETRLLVHEPGGWVPLTYVWNPSGTDATLELAGDTVGVSWIDEAGATQSLDYSVPNANMCKECHGDPTGAGTLGGRTRQLNRARAYATGEENQIDHLAVLGWIDTAPPPAAEREALPDPFGTAPVGDRARSYLDSNCAHCHTTASAASSSGLYLDWHATEPGGAAASFGICKTPTSAGGATCGLTYDIVPGQPEQSILICRVASREPKVQMPPLATKLAHTDAVKLLSDWVAGLTNAPCK